MAFRRINGKLGSVVGLDAGGYGGDISTWRLRTSQPVGDVTSYADNTQVSRQRGSGISDVSLSATGFATAGAGATAPGIDFLDEDPCSITLQADTGCTYGGNFIVTSAELNHAKRAPSIPVSYDGVADGDLTPIWATT